MVAASVGAAVGSVEVGSSTAMERQYLVCFPTRRSNLLGSEYSDATDGLGNERKRPVDVLEEDGRRGSDLADEFSVSSLHIDVLVDADAVHDGVLEEVAEVTVVEMLSVSNQGKQDMRRTRRGSWMHLDPFCSTLPSLSSIEVSESTVSW